MDKRESSGFRWIQFACWFVAALILCCWRAQAEPAPAAVAGFNNYAAKVEARLTREHLGRASFISGGVEGERARRLHGGDVLIEELTPSQGGDLPGAMLHDWRGTAFVPGVRAQDFERLLKDFNDYPKVFAPQVLASHGTVQTGDQTGDHMESWMRVRQKHVITVVMDSSYDVSFGRLDAVDGYSTSRSTRIQEIEDIGTAREHALPDGQEHGFLWRLNSYWSYEERDGGLYIQIESVSLSRSIPTGLGWAVGPFVEKVPRESLEFTLRSAVKAVRR